LLSPNERVLRARLAAHTLHARYDSTSITERARAAARSALDRRLVEEHGIDLALPDAPVRLAHARRAHFARLALRAVRARRRASGRGLQAGEGGVR